MASPMEVLKKALTPISVQAAERGNGAVDKVKKFIGIQDAPKQKTDDEEKRKKFPKTFSENVNDLDTDALREEAKRRANKSLENK